MPITRVVIKGFIFIKSSSCGTSRLRHCDRTVPLCVSVYVTFINCTAWSCGQVMMRPVTFGDVIHIPYIPQCPLYHPLLLKTLFNHFHLQHLQSRSRQTLANFLQFVRNIFFIDEHKIEIFTLFGE